jgi:hypothetical protein
MAVAAIEVFVIFNVPLSFQKSVFL